MKQKDIILLVTSVFSLTIFWIIFSVYHNFITSTIPETLSAQISPINPIFDTKTIDNLKQRIQITPIYNQIATQSSQIVIPTPTPTPTPPIASQSALIENIASNSAATSGGTLR